MTEIRKWVGLSFEDFIALHRAVQEIKELLTAIYGDDWLTPCVLARLDSNDGKECFVHVLNKRTGLERSQEEPILDRDMVKMTKHQSNGDEFTVQIVIKEKGLLKTSCCMDRELLGKDRGEHDKHGTLDVGPAIRSRIACALGHDSVIQPLYFTIKK